MATVLVEVTLPNGDPQRSDQVPDDVLELAAAVPQVQGHGWAKRGASPWRMRLLVRGPDCIATAHSLERALRNLGYEADATFLP
jgi:hypothetical protein